MTDEDVEHRLTAVDARCKSNQHRLDDVERRQEQCSRGSPPGHPAQTK